MAYFIAYCVVGVMFTARIQWDLAKAAIGNDPAAWLASLLVGVAAVLSWPAMLIFQALGKDPL